MSEVLKRHIDELTMDDIYQYHHDGIMVITGIFDDVELKVLQDEADRVTEEAVAHKGENHLYLKKDDLGTEYFEYWEKTFLLNCCYNCVSWCCFFCTESRREYAKSWT